ncbi:MAG: hypothetical protein OXH31_06120 [Gammaproteobacteria bacterium]|nr:hypothetical protein [Gammaproteobacteria bacterium]
MKALSVSVLILVFLISGCASVHNSVPETHAAGSETIIPESTESPAETAETEKPSLPTNEDEESPLNPLLSLDGDEIQDKFNNQLVGLTPYDVYSFLQGFVHGLAIGVFGLMILGAVLSGL